MAIYEINGRWDNIKYVARVISLTWWKSSSKKNWKRMLRLIPRIRISHLRSNMEREIAEARQTTAEMNSILQAVEMTRKFNGEQQLELEAWCAEQQAMRQFHTQPFVDKVNEIASKAA